ncbi:major facilitator superfamily domain-containing protein [Mycena maculata]|uniref:Major facilitator superfamily domain-containing protein n=1 Tax=Mycena maculata TaxID=230809 RepID=A0AAD7MMN9_9AGAR|nr:major facilitator superfamily domain-containing protein [Mycena maculata]
MRAPTESSPLLLETQQTAKKQVPIPRAQLAALCISRMTDPVAYTQIFPYINEFLILLHVTDDVSKIGFYSGLVDLDVVGRRPIILLGALGLAVVTTLLGFCTSLSQIIINVSSLCKSRAGAVAGNAAVYHAVLAEITHPSNQAVAYPLYAFIWPFGATIGPLIGGMASNLGTKYPEYFGYDFLLAYPYFMPNFVCALLVILGFVMAYFFLEETLPSKRRGLSGAPPDNYPPPLGGMALLSIPMLRALTASGFALGFIGTAFDVVFVAKIGYALALNGGILAFFQLFLMPTLLHRYNVAKMYNTSMRFWPLTFVLMPFLHLIVRGGYDAERGLVDPTAAAVLWVGITVVLTCSRIAALAFASASLHFIALPLTHCYTRTNMIIIRNHSPGPNSLGAVNGLVQVAMGVSRCFSPAFISSVFALSVDNDLFWGYPIWVVVMLSLCWVGCYFSQKMVAIDEKTLRS